MHPHHVDHCPGGELSGHLGPIILPGNTPVALNLHFGVKGGKEIIEVELPIVVSAQQPMSEPRIPNMRGIMTARTKPLKVVEATGNETKTEIDTFSLPPQKTGVKMIAPENAGELITLLRNEAKVI